MTAVFIRTLGHRHVQKEDHQRYWNKTDVWEPRKEALKETNRTNTLISNSQPLQLWKNEFLWFKPPSLWYFVMAALENKCVCDHLMSRVWLFVTPWTVSHQALCPWNSPGKNTGVDCHSLFQGIFPTQRSNPHLLCLLHCRRRLYHWAIREAPRKQINIQTWIIDRKKASPVDSTGTETRCKSSPLQRCWGAVFNNMSFGLTVINSCRKLLHLSKLHDNCANFIKLLG